MFHGLELSINRPVFSQPSQWSTIFLPGVIPPPSEAFKHSRPGKEEARREAESTNRGLGRAPLGRRRLCRASPNAAPAVGASLAGGAHSRRPRRWRASSREREEGCQEERGHRRSPVPTARKALGRMREHRSPGDRRSDGCSSPTPRKSTGRERVRLERVRDGQQLFLTAYQLYITFGTYLLSKEWRLRLTA